MACIRDRGDQICGNLEAVELVAVCLKSPDAYATGLQGHDCLIGSPEIGALLSMSFGSKRPWRLCSIDSVSGPVSVKLSYSELNQARNKSDLERI